MNEALAESDVHHAVHIIAELRDVIRSKGVDEFLCEVSQRTINYFAIRDANLI